MPSVLDEQTQFIDPLTNKLLVNGKAYFGGQNADPIVSPVSIFADRELTTPLANPQTLDSSGRTTNKVWIAGRYSLRVDDLNDVQKYQELDNGESPDVGVTSLENVTGANTIVAEGVSTITAYEDLEQYTGRVAQTNTGNITLNIDGVGAKSVLQNHIDEIPAGGFIEDQNFIVSYNLTDDIFELVNQNSDPVIPEGFKSLQIFTASGTWTKPAGINTVLTKAWGGGGGGGATASANIISGCGGGGGYTQELIDVSAISSETITIGAGGAVSGAGGTSSFGAHCSATGGGAGSDGVGSGGTGGAGSGGDLNLSGGIGSQGIAGATNAGNAGGSPFGGAGGAGANRANGGAGTVGTAPGGGGGGDAHDTTTPAAGAAGLIIVEEYA